MISAEDKNESVGTLFLDLSKAFDLVNHAILLKNLSHSGLYNTAIDWFKTYLHSRTQNDIYFWETIYPRGSRSRCSSGLCPRSVTIFDLYDLPLILSHSCADMFADNTTLSTHNTSLDVVITSLTNDVLHVDRWCQHDHMSINSDISNVYQFETKSSISKF